MKSKADAAQNFDSPSLGFLMGGGAMGERIRVHDWSTSPLGVPATWPQSLRSVVGLLLSSRFPMFVAWGSELTFIYNDPYSEILGAKHPRALGSRFYDIWSEIWPDISPLVDAAMAGEATYRENLPLLMNRRGFNEQTWFTFSYSPVRDETGEVAGMFCACTETTALVVAERQRASELERQTQMFEQAPGFICILRGPEHVFEFVNNTHRQLFGSTGWIGKPVREAFPDIAGQGYYELLDKVYATGERHVASSAPIRFRPGPDSLEQQRFLDFIFAPMFDEAGAVSGIFCEGFDVTERKQAEEALRDADRRKDEFLATLAHELRNPLAPIRNAVQVLKTPEASELQRQWSRSIIERQVRHMAHLLDDLLDVSRITRGKLELRKTQMPLHLALEAAIETARPVIDAKEQTLEVELPDTPFTVEADPIRLVQILGNLLTNAAKYSDPGARIQVTFRAEHCAAAGAQALITVRDTGMGMTPEQLSRLFQMFEQAPEAAGRADGGLGVGLALTRALVELHGGTIEAHSEGPGKGSVFTVRLPLWRAAAGFG